jgi:DNA-binding response OmpR family regulator
VSRNPSRSAGRLLVVEDDEAVQVLLCAIFKRYGVQVDVVTNSTAALRALQATHYDAVIVEPVLHGSNGYDLLNTLRTDESRVLERTFVVTTADDRSLAKFTDIRWVRSVIHKPFDLQRLIEEVLACVSPAVDELRPSLEHHLN